MNGMVVPISSNENGNHVNNTDQLGHSGVTDPLVRRILTLLQVLTLIFAIEYVPIAIVGPIGIITDFLQNDSGSNSQYMTLEINPRYKVVNGTVRSQSLLMYLNSIRPDYFMQLTANSLQRTACRSMQSFTDLNVWQRELVWMAIAAMKKPGVCLSPALHLTSDGIRVDFNADGSGILSVNEQNHVKNSGRVEFNVWSFHTPIGLQQEKIAMVATLLLQSHCKPETRNGRAKKRQKHLRDIARGKLKIPKLVVILVACKYIRMWFRILQLCIPHAVIRVLTDSKSCSGIKENMPDIILMSTSSFEPGNSCREVLKRPHDHTVMGRDDILTLAGCKVALMLFDEPGNEEVLEGKPANQTSQIQTDGTGTLARQLPDTLTLIRQLFSRPGRPWLFLFRMNPSEAKLLSAIYTAGEFPGVGCEIANNNSLLRYSLLFFNDWKRKIAAMNAHTLKPVSTLKSNPIDRCMDTVNIAVLCHTGSHKQLEYMQTTAVKLKCGHKNQTLGELVKTVTECAMDYDETHKTKMYDDIPSRALEIIRDESENPNTGSGKVMPPNREDQVQAMMSAVMPFANPDSSRNRLATMIDDANNVDIASDPNIMRRDDSISAIVRVLGMLSKNRTHCIVLYIQTFLDGDRAQQAHIRARLGQTVVHVPEQQQSKSFERQHKNFTRGNCVIMVTAKTPTWVDLQMATHVVFVGSERELEDHHGQNVIELCKGTERTCPLNVILMTRVDPEYR